jgi:hypothetical protein
MDGTGRMGEVRNIKAGVAWSGMEWNGRLGVGWIGLLRSVKAGQVGHGGNGLGPDWQEWQGLVGRRSA